MANTNFAVNHPLAQKIWSKKLAREAMYATQLHKFMSTDPDSMIQVYDEPTKANGDRVTIGLKMLLTGRGVGEGQQLEGNEEALVFLNDAFVINEMNHATRKSTQISDQRVPFATREEIKRSLRDWYAARIDTILFNQICGNTGVVDTIYTGWNAAAAPTSATGNMRIVYADGASTTEGSLSASQTFNLSMIDTAVNIAETAAPLIRPIKQGDGEYYVMFLHPNQVRSLRQTTGATGWTDIQKAAMSGGDIEDNPIFTGALGVYNGVVLHKSARIPVAPTNSSVRRAVLCGAQAACLAFGKGYGEQPKWEEESFDYGRELGVSVQTIIGAKKTQFSNSGAAGGGVVDYGTIVVSTFAANP